MTRAIRRGDFREDLLHRFAPPIRIPPLRERREEILPHARGWLTRKAAQTGLPPPVLTAAAAEFLQQHRWPGNVRQLQTVIAHCVLLADGKPIDVALLKSLTDAEAVPATYPSSWDDWQAYRRDQEREWLQQILERHQGNAELAARSIGCPSSTLRHTLKKHGLDARSRKEPT